MKYEVGDKIIVLHSHEEGDVIEIINEKMVMIEVRGVKFPAYMDQIDFPYFYRFSKKKIVQEKKPTKVFLDQIPKEKSAPATIKTEDGVWLSFIPKFSMDEFDDEVVTSLKIYIVNKTSKGYKFLYRQSYVGELNFELQSTILPHHDLYLHDMDFACVNDSPSFIVEFSLEQPEKKKAPYFETSLKLKPKQVFKKIEELKEQNQPVLSYNLFTQYPDKAFEEKGIDMNPLLAKGFKVYDAKQIKNNLPPARSVVDLHIEKITDNWQGLSNFEILSIQLNEFEKWMEAAIANKLTAMVIIHGVGTGKLKDEIHQLLKTKNAVNYFINQYDPRFGHGATEVFFK